MAAPRACSQDPADAVAAAVMLSPVPAALLDRAGGVLVANQALAALVGSTPERLAGDEFGHHLHPDDTRLVFEALGSTVGRPITRGVRVVTSDGRLRQLRLHLGPVGDGIVVYLDGASPAATEAIRAARARAQAADQRFRLLVDSLPDPVMMFDADLRYRYANPTACALLGRQLGSLRGRRPRESGLPPALAGAWERAIEDVLATGAVRDLELSFLGKTGQRWFWTRLAPERDGRGRVAEVVAVGRDITDRKEAERRLQDLARRDPLTGLANRRHLEDVLRRGLEHSHLGGQSLAVLFLDLDGLKQVNDTHGHDVGDGLLLAVARRLRHVARVHDTVARLGGDEFVVVCEAITGPAEAVEVARRILARTNRPYAVDGMSLSIGASLGVVTVAPHEAATVTPPQLLREADAAMYHAKVHGGATLATFDRGADQPVLPVEVR